MNTSLAIGVLAVAAVVAAPGRADEPGRRSFEVTASRFQYEPDTLEVREGDSVRITLRSADGTHGFAIKEYKVKKAIPKGGAPVTVEFVADKAGTFTFACSEYCGSGHRQMKGRLVVAPRAE